MTILLNRETPNREVNSRISLKIQNIWVFVENSKYFEFSINHVIYTYKRQNCNFLIKLFLHSNAHPSQRQPDNNSVASEKWNSGTQPRGGKISKKKNIYFFKQKKQNSNIWKEKTILWTNPKSKVVDNPIGLEKLPGTTISNQYNTSTTTTP